MLIQRLIEPLIYTNYTIENGINNLHQILWITNKSPIHKALIPPPDSSRPRRHILVIQNVARFRKYTMNLDQLNLYQGLKVFSKERDKA